MRDTGERLLLDGPARSREEHLNRLVHLATYAFAARAAAGARVLDLGCGTGYGAAGVAEVAREVVAADVCAETLDHARARHARANLSFCLLQEGTPLPFAAGAFEVVLSFQVIEHLRDPHAHLAEIRRVLLPGGRLLLATPNRTVRLFSHQRPWNRWHPVEYDQQTLEALLGDHFEAVESLTMGGEAALIGPELARYARLRWLTLPATLPGLPEAWRVAALSVMRAVQRLARSAPPPGAFPGAVDDLRIGPGEDPALNLLAIATRGPAG